MKSYRRRLDIGGGGWDGEGVHGVPPESVGQGLGVGAGTPGGAGLQPSKLPKLGVVRTEPRARPRGLREVFRVLSAACCADIPRAPPGLPLTEDARRDHAPQPKRPFL